jgi:uncharacterized protein YfaS (alpha-2-macroglobulin family)
MRKPNYRLLRILLPLCLFILGCPAPSSNQLPSERNREDSSVFANSGLTLLGEISYLAPESIGSFLLQVRDPDTDEAVTGAEVEVQAEHRDAAPVSLFSGKTNDEGLLHVRFAVPGNLPHRDHNLTISVASSKSSSNYQETVYIGRVFSILVSTDKPVYQPGQTIHIRTLALDTIALKAAQGENLILSVTDPDGNKLFHRELATSEYGVASADFVVDTEVPSGDYIITATMGPISSSRSVEIKPYTLPRFSVNFSPDRSYYLPGETASATITAEYFFGKPVAGGLVEVTAFGTDVERFQLFKLEGTTDDTGSWSAEFQVPNYFVGQLDNQSAEIDLEITVIDTAYHSEKIDESITVAEKPILIDGAAESGILRANLENRIYFDTSYPDGRPAPAVLLIASDALSESLSLSTDDFGLAYFDFIPTSPQDVAFTVEAATTGGITTSQTLTFGATGINRGLLLRPGKPRYRIGETMELDLFVAGNAKTVYLDIIKGRQTFGLVALPVTNGVAKAAIDLDGGLLGTLELNGYWLTDQGEIIRDRRLVLVDPAPADIKIATNAQLYRPGESATITVSAQHAGLPMQGVLGISIVDESIFSIGAQSPGFARTFFLLERELQEPRYEIHDFVSLEDDDSSPYDDKPKNLRIGGSPADRSNAPQDDPRQIALLGLFGQVLAQDYLPEPLHLPAQLAPGQALNWQVTAETWPIRILFVVPLLSLAFANGRANRRRLMLLLLLYATSAALYSACGSSGSSPQFAADAAPASTTATRGATRETRLRQYFPETLYWQPEQPLDEHGASTFAIPLADSITSWRISVTASDTRGNLGSAETNIKVFQDFFIEPDLPRFLTVGDELELPITIYNYSDQNQSIELQVEAGTWFSSPAGSSLTATVAVNEVISVYYPLRVTEFGDFPLTIHAKGNSVADAIQRMVSIIPDGSRTTVAQSGLLENQATISLNIPDEAITGTAQLLLKFYPGPVSHIIDGLDGLLQQPYGCFEQTSSTTYPNVLVLDYLTSTGQAAPAVQMRAEQLINLGYQRLLTFEVNGIPGGFSLFGDAPADTILTAYGLMEFTDMGKVAYVDPALIGRVADFLISQQRADGSWSGKRRTAQDSLIATAYVTWALSNAGYSHTNAVQQALAFIEHKTFEANDPYVVALAANALVAAGKTSPEILRQLVLLSQPGTAGTRYWFTALPTWLDSHGIAADIETTALAAIALLRSNHELAVAEQAVEYILQQRDPYGSFYTTQATILALKALLLSAQMGATSLEADVSIILDEKPLQSINISPATANQVQMLRLDDLPRSADSLVIELEGERALHYQVVAQYYLPWDNPSLLPDPTDQPMRVEVEYDRSTLQVNDIVNVSATVELLAKGRAGTVIVDLALPPGFTPLVTDLDGLVTTGLIERYELTGRQIILYLTNVASNSPLVFPYRLQARYPIRAQVSHSRAYDYYTPEHNGSSPPQRVTVTLGTPPQ